MVEISTGERDNWRPATLDPHDEGCAWRRWTAVWRPPGPGRWTLRARATDVTGAAQPEQAAPNALGFLFDGIVRHPVTVA
ncbi:hypothetical protein [Micromonospora inyonensis]|uniref:hypothetical protein n=1 Tax=Micromonospora inyonensis TaxID=47866 RepID=UPI00114CB864|nr:hypothetical protein [Micromonospora inyonensis]